MLKDFITTQKAFIKSVEEKLDKLENLSSKVDNLAHEVELRKIRTSPLEERKVTPMNAMQVQINEKIRMMAKLKERWAREKVEEDRIKSLPTHHIVATIQIVEDTQTISTQCTPSPIGPINGDGNTSTVDKETPMNIEGFKQVSLDDTTTTFDSSDLILIVAPYQKLLAYYTKCLETPTLAHLILPSRSISQMLLSKLGSRSLHT